MAQVYLGLGSNIERERYITAGLDALQVLLGELHTSAVYDCPAVGFDGQPFLNMVVSAHTDLPLATLAARLRHIEYEHGRPVDAERFSARQLDIDILLYDDLVGTFGEVTLPRGEILENAFVLRPLAELTPTLIHPVADRSLQALWREYDAERQPLVPVDFSWRGRAISAAEPPAGDCVRR